MILVAGMASGARVLFPNAGGALLDGAAFNNLAKLKKSTTPVQAANALYRVLPAPPPTAQQAIPPQIIHGLEDSMIHPSCAREVHRACNAFHPLPPAFIPSGGHELERYVAHTIPSVTPLLSISRSCSDPPPPSRCIAAGPTASGCYK